MSALPHLSRDDALELVKRKRNLDWLAILKAEARGRQMFVFSKAIDKEITTQRVMFWSIVDREGLATISVDEITRAAREVASAAE